MPPERERVAFLDDHVALGDRRRRRIVAARPLGGLLHQSPGPRARPRVRRTIVGRRATPPKWSRWPWLRRMYLMSDYREALLLDAVDDVVDVGLFRAVDQDRALRCRDQPHRHEAGPDIVEIVEHLDGRDLLIRDVVLLAAAIGFAELFLLRSLRESVRDPLRLGRAGRRTRMRRRAPSSDLTFSWILPLPGRSRDLSTNRSEAKTNPPRPAR